MTDKSKSKPPASQAAKPPAKAAPAKADPKKTAETTGSPNRFIYVFGAEEGGKPRGARFSLPDVDKIMDSVREMKLAMCEDHSPRMTELGMKLPLGRVYARGKAFIPFIRKELFDQLRDAQFGPPSAPAGKEIPQSDVAYADSPTSWKEITVGNEVIAHNTDLEGWWEAIVVARDGDLVTVKWTDYPQEGMVKRHITSIALRHPGPYKCPV
jgi:hypothetical protein